MKMTIPVALAASLVSGALILAPPAAPEAPFDRGRTPVAPRSGREDASYAPSPVWGNSFIRNRLEGVFVNMVDVLWTDWILSWNDYCAEKIYRLPRKTGISLATFYVPVNSTLRVCPLLPDPGETVEEWANMEYLENLVDLLDFCSRIGIRAEIDLATNCWVPYSVDTANHIAGQPGPCWPIPDDDPWDETIAWVSGLIEYVEANVEDPQAIALWSLTGNYVWGTAEPALWDAATEVMSAHREFLQNVWPAFAAAGSRPKGIIILPLLAADYPSASRLSAFANLIEYLDGLAAPDYLVVTSYGGMDNCVEWSGETRDVLREIVDLAAAAWPGGAGKIVLSDFKWADMDIAETIVSREGMSRSDVFRWHFAACDRYGLAGWWWWCYIGSDRGIRDYFGWKEDLVAAVSARTMRTDIAVFRPADGLWAVRGGERASFGGPGSIAAPADYDGDGRAEFAVFIPADGRWRVRGRETVYFGREGDEAVPADYFDDGHAAPAVFRPGEGLWAVRDLTRAYFGAPGDIPVTADYDGDGRDDPAVFRPASGLWHVQGITRVVFGSAGDLPAPSDYAGEGTASVAIFRPSAGAWRERGGDGWEYYGSPGDLPVPGDYNGDGSVERAVFRPSSGEWLVEGYTRACFGASGDIPVSVAGAIALGGRAAPAPVGGGR